jgi:hypothetical protein
LDNFFFKNFEIVQGRLKRAWRHTWVKNNFERERIVLKKLLFEFRAGSKGLGLKKNAVTHGLKRTRHKTSLVALTDIHGHRTLKAPHPV